MMNTINFLVDIIKFLSLPIKNISTNTKARPRQHQGFSVRFSAKISND